MIDKTKYCTLEEVRNEIVEILKKVVKAEYCPHCKEMQSMWIIYHIDQDIKSFPPKITESLRCPGCLKLFANKLEEVTDNKQIKRDPIGFEHEKTKDLKNNKIKKEETTETEC